MTPLINKSAIFLPLLSVLCCVAGITLARLEVIRPASGLMLFALGALVGLLSIAAALLVMLVTRAWPLAFLAMIGMLPVIALLSSASAAFRYPRINDISTDTANPPAFVHAAELLENAGRDLGFPVASAPQIAQAYPEVAPLEVPLAPQAAYERALLLATRIPDWTVTFKDPEQLTFEAIAVTKVFHFRDDIAVRITPMDADESRIDMRSKSRDGQSDLGANAKRIVAYLAKLRLSR